MNDDATGPERRSAWGGWLALLRQRCPRCRRGKIFRSGITMNDPCPECGLIFEREPGYLLGAMYFSYFLGIAIITPLFFGGKWLLPEWNEMLIALTVVIIYLPLVPIVFRYSRVMWIHYDRLWAPSDLSDHQGWRKWREQESDQAK
jgi:uncharacterized protein (DUF983 family)